MEAHADPSALEALEGAALRGEKIGVACSGGADSVFALYLAADIFSERLENLVVLHFNHKVRDAAETDELYVRGLCEKLGLRFVGGSPKSRPKKADECALRELRLGFFARCAKRLGLSAIVQGHHCGDVLESALMRLARGSGSAGLSAPRPISNYGNAVFIRPLLPMKKTDIVENLVGAKIAWREDESNAGLDYFRNRIRNAVVPVFERASQFDVFGGACRTRALLQEDSDALDSIFAEIFNRLNGGGAGTKRMSLGAELSAYPAFARRAAAKFVAENSLEMRSGAVDALVEKIVSGKACRMSAGVCGGGRRFVVYDPASRELSLAPEKSAEKFLVELKPGKNILPGGSVLGVKEISAKSPRAAAAMRGENDDRFAAYLDVSALAGGALLARSRQSGDAYAPLGSASPKKLKDIFCAKKVPSAKRNSFPVVCNAKGEILWVPSLPPSAAHKLRGSARVLELTFAPATA